MKFFKSMVAIAALSPVLAQSAVHENKLEVVIEIPANTKEERSKIANLGYAIDEVRSDRVFILGSKADAAKIAEAGFNVESAELKSEWLNWNPQLDPRTDELREGRLYHNYDEVTARMQELEANHPEIFSLSNIGRSIENREIPIMRVSSKSLGDAETAKLPVVMFMGCHHAREHLSVEMPLMLLEYFAEEYGKHPDITRLLDTREIYIAPMINPDGHTHDFRDNRGNGRMWRKNRRANNNGTYGVDLNRNYGYMWGTGGSSNNPRSDVYMGTEPFSEPETRAVRDFARAQPRMSMMLSFHTFSELILYPWGHSYDKIGQERGDAADLPVFEKMARDMAVWNKYTPEQSSDLYIASGDTTDWAYGELGVFAFTFELTPTSLWDGGFYPEPTVIQPTFESNLKPMLYMIEFADNPSRVLSEEVPDFEKTPSRVGIGMASFEDVNI